MIENKNIVVTGGAGFVGSHLVEMLAPSNNIKVIDDFSRGNHVVDGVEYIKNDIGNQPVCEVYFRDADYIFNLAAHVAGVMYNQSHHLEMYQKNIRLLTTPLIAAERCGFTGRFLQVSSVCVYPTEVYDGRRPAPEEYGLWGEPQPANHGYSEAKRDGERAATWSRVDTVVVRPSNVAGPRDYFDEKAHVIPALIERLVRDKVLSVYGDQGIVREFIHPKDVAAGMIAVAEYGDSNHAYNLGSGNVVSLSDLVNCLLDCSGIKKDVQWIKANDPGDAYRRSNTTKANALGWKSEKSIQDICKDAFEYYLEMEE